jgi:hypothetical protein
VFEGTGFRNELKLSGTSSHFLVTWHREIARSGVASAGCTLEENGHGAGQAEAVVFRPSQGGMRRPLR